jgi:erythromycin esterase
MKNTLTLLLVVILNTYCIAQCSPELKQYSTSFDEIKAESFTFLDSQLKDVQIVGYGEDTHGTSEFTVLAKELIKYLSDKHGFKVFILETGFGEGLYLNEYIHGVRDDLKIILDEHNSTWRYKTEEFYMLMNWLREYNHNNSDKIYLYGSEMQYVISDVNRIHEYLKKVNSEYKIEGFEKHLWEAIEEDEKIKYYNSYAKLKKYFIENFELFKSKSSEDSFNLAYHHIEVLGQFATAINQNVQQRKHDLRDLYMGENIQWILNFHGRQSKALYWAHNAHIGDWVGNGIVDVTGHQLKKNYGDSYFNIATDFGLGEFIAFSNDGTMKPFGYDKILDKTFTECLKSFGKPNTFLNLREARKDKNLHSFLNTPLTTMSGAGAQVRNSQTETQLIGKAFDAIIYLDQTSKINWAK